MKKGLQYFTVKKITFFYMVSACLSIHNWNWISWIWQSKNNNQKKENNYDWNKLVYWDIGSQSEKWKKERQNLEKEKKTLKKRTNKNSWHPFFSVSVFLFFKNWNYKMFPKWEIKYNNNNLL